MKASCDTIELWLQRCGELSVPSTLISIIFKTTREYWWQNCIEEKARAESWTEGTHVYTCIDGVNICGGRAEVAGDTALHSLHARCTIEEATRLVCTDPSTKSAFSQYRERSRVFRADVECRHIWQIMTSEWGIRKIRLMIHVELFTDLCFDYVSTHKKVYPVIALWVMCPGRFFRRL